MRVTNRNERLDMIVRSLSGGGEVTLREIAKRQGLQVTPYLSGCVSQLVNDGHLNKTVLDGVYPTTYLYSLTEAGQGLADLVIRLYGEG